ncbi:MAG TPA: ATP-binding protein, partial [Cyclobacteriaceae bacterium]
VNLARIEHERERMERIQLMEKQKIWLEENVRLRTMELTQKTYEIEAQNEELKQQHEELSATHDLLEKHKELVEGKNRDIENINHSLEQKVHERTMEIEEAMKRLIKQNHDLQQFSFIVSHNMRSPVARILGLLELIKMEDSTVTDQELYYQYLKESALGLDQIISDLNQIITIRKGMDIVEEKIDFEKILKHNQTDLIDEITRAGAEVITSINVDEFDSVKGYVQSILYNLLSNAVKYRSPNRNPLVTIRIFEQNGYVLFEVKDNGLGINLPESRLHEVFSLYKRLHTHVQGKGLGLYLVKTQVEALNGKIEVQSKTGIGTIFLVSIPKNSRAQSELHY